MGKCEEAVGSSDTIRSFERALQILTAFNREKICMTAADVASSTGLPNSTALHFLQDLCRLGYLVRQRKGFRLTPKVMMFSRSFLSPESVKDCIEAILDELAERLQETCVLSVRDGGESVSVFCGNAKSMGAIAMTAGSRIPLHLSSPGRIFLAAFSDDELIEYFKNADLQRYTSHTIATKCGILGTLDNVRRERCAVAREERMEGVFGIAVPVMVENYDTVPATLSVMGNIARLDCESAIASRIKALNEAARQINAALRGKEEGVAWLPAPSCFA